ncbi:Bifunctional ATP-dependent dihydroxyacetone kinase/FAD-AMP lyase [Aphelenchoides fujianensis]|nr:Bifunctional ATP-dependent dihydroxyacetone kinase/FAD-AMP lyase [Aphelenchoides fujianensis]
MPETKKKFCNKPENAVDDALRGLVAADDQLQFHPQNPRVVLRKDVEELRKDGRVTIACGGGSGHEPFASGLVGKNALTAAIAGNLFASPPSNHVADALEAIRSPGGSLLFVINYTGDRLHFGMAIERAKAKADGEFHCRFGSFFVWIDVYIDDDVALEHKLGSTVGGRGLAGALLALQIAGVLADERRAKFDEIRDTSRKVVENMGTFGVSLYPCALPGKEAMFELPDDQIELGLGIHGEPGCERTRLGSAREIVGTILERLTASKRLALEKGDRLVVLLNNLGGTSQLEMGVLQTEVLEWLRSAKAATLVERFLSGTLMTSLDGHGVSITLLKVREDEWLKLLDAPSRISALWKATRPRTEPTDPPKHSEFDETKAEIVGVEVGGDIAEKIEKSLRAACAKLVESEDALNKLDAHCGDGDCGSSLKSAAQGILQAADSKRLAFTHPKSLCLQLSKICEHSVGGTSGALYALFFSAGSRAFDRQFGDAELRAAIREGLQAITYYGHAQPGHRTLAKSGRASYTSREQQREPDPGAKAIALWFRAAFDGLR